MNPNDSERVLQTIAVCIANPERPNRESAHYPIPEQIMMSHDACVDLWETLRAHDQTQKPQAVLREPSLPNYQDRVSYTARPYYPSAIFYFLIPYLVALDFMPSSQKITKKERK